MSEKDGHLQIKLKSDTKDVLYIQVQGKKLQIHGKL
jgi:hypothetical protein